MSVSATVNRRTVIAAVAVVAIAVGGAVALRGGDEPAATPSGAQVLQPSEPLDVIGSRTPAESAVEVSRRFFESAPVVVLTAADEASQQRAVDAADRLGAPVLIDAAGADAEIERLGASRVLQFGTTRQIEGVNVVPEEETDPQGLIVDGSTPNQDVVVVTRSLAKNAAAVATARHAGAEVLEIPDADARTDPEAVEVLGADRPVIALGAPFRDFGYTLDVVRAGATQAGGGYLALPGRHYAAMYGHPETAALGVLGEQGVEASIDRVKRLQAKYEAVAEGEIVPTFEIIATVASAGAGDDKDYSRETPIETLTPLVDAAEEAGVYVIIDLQPGRSDFVSQAKAYEPLLRRPHVGLALDPEWRLERDEKHLEQIGSVTAEEVNKVGTWLADLTRAHTLPQKLFVLHQFAGSMIQDRSRVDTSRPELATLIHVDGQGSQPAKQGTWEALRRGAPDGVFWGWKNFVDEDEPMLTVPQTWARVKPLPDLVTYQ